MIHIHPFPARMAPEIALSKIESLSSGQTVLDPMAGSGMVLCQAAKNGFQSIGYDLDPLARLISRSCATKINEKLVEDAMGRLLESCSQCKHRRNKVYLDWIDSDKETSSFIDFWFHPKQKKQLRLLSYYLMAKPIVKNQKVLDILKVALSRLIITKEPKASLARDTAHSRPHRTISENDFDIIAELPASLNHVLRALDSSKIQLNTKTYLGDARKMMRIFDASIDAIVTSPPYLNAIDYMRGHRLSLVWFGYTLEKLRKIRRISIGSERSISGTSDELFADAIQNLELDNLDNRNLRMLNRYFRDLLLQTKESYRVLKPGSFATYVMGNSTIRGNYIQNSELLKKAGILSGFSISNESIREIPNNRRYLPVTVKSENSLASRMRTEHIIEFLKEA